jgi:broad specificity phosphatase PhoE
MMRADINLTLWSVRHGQTRVNASADTIGQSPTEPLTEIGRQQAKLLGERLRKEVVFDAAYCSTYLRALDTYKLANPTLNGHYSEVHDIREIERGVAQDKPIAEVFAEAGSWDRYRRNGMGFAFPGGESQFDVQSRFVKWLNKEILDNPYTRNDKHLNILLVSHGMSLKCLLQHVMQYDHRMNGRVNLSNTSITKLRLKNTEWFVESINDTAHLFNQNLHQSSSATV